MNQRKFINITHLRIGLLGTKNLRLQKQLHRQLQRGEMSADLPDDENNYWAEAIEDGDEFYFRVNGTTVEITESEFGRVIINPSLYYFSTALELHVRIKWAADGVLFSKAERRRPQDIG